MKLLLNILISIILLLGATAGKSADIKLTEENHVLLRGEINSKSVARAGHAILTHPQDEVYLFIDSPGGMVFSGLQLANILEHSGKKITCIANVAASMAFYLLQHCETRLVMEHSLVMQHVAHYALIGDAPNNFSFSTFFQTVAKSMTKKQAERLGLSEDEFSKKIRDEWWLYGENVVEANAADDVTTVECSNELAMKTIKKKVRTLFWSVEAEYSACPLVSSPVRVGTQRLGTGKSVEASEDLAEIMKGLDVKRGLEVWHSQKKNPRSSWPKP